MSPHRTVWHFYFAVLLRQRAPCWIEVRDEVPLSEERPRIDYLFLRKVRDPPTDDTGQTLCRLWPLISQAAIVEFKSTGRPYRARGLDRLFGYMHAYFADASDLAQREDLVGVLIVADRSAALDKDVASIGLEFRDLRDGYWKLTGGLFTVYVVEIDRVGDQERDGVLRSFGHPQEPTREALRFWAEQVGTKEAEMNVQQLEGYEEAVALFLSKLSPAERLAGLSRDDILLALPDDELRRLPESYLATFPESVRESVRKRIGR
jgi:hypothetical protein